MSFYDAKLKRFEKCHCCYRHTMCFITENDNEELEFYCEHCYPVVPVKKLKTQPRKNNDPSFVGNARFFTIQAKIPKVPYGK